MIVMPPLKKGARSHFRGYPITWDGKQWLFNDTGKPTVESYGERPCGKCGKVFQGDCDPCLGMLPGVVNACCGHGVAAESYIKFSNGITVRGFTIDKDPTP